MVLRDGIFDDSEVVMFYVNLLVIELGFRSYGLLEGKMVGSGKMR